MATFKADVELIWPNNRPTEAIGVVRKNGVTVWQSEPIPIHSEDGEAEIEQAKRLASDELTRAFMPNPE